ncbi:MAG TPA: glycosyltransferase family 2 protein [Candidatus Angelobacter sp.]|jgi:cellulose synthase/poly-beta-1,6-N-acetylglucosamine synthase-like glycosyltransferase
MAAILFTQLGGGITSASRVVFWLTAFLLFYVYAGYPLLLAVIGLFVRRRRPEPGYAPRISVLIAAYNEEEAIERKIQQTLALEYPADKIQVIVLSDCSTDRTDEIVKAFPDNRVRLVRMPERRGKTYAQNYGVKEVTGDVVVFSDATAIYQSKALVFLACNYQDACVGAVSGRYQYFDPGEQSPTGLGSKAFWNYENLIKTLQSRIHTITGCCGCIYSVRKTAYTELPADIISDLVQPLQAIRKGYRVVFEDRALAYEETTQSTAEEFSMRVRVVTRAMRGLLSVPDLLQPWKFAWPAFQLWSHKIMRWMVPLFLIALLGANFMLVDFSFYRLVLAAQLAFYAAAILNMLIPLHRQWKPLGIPLFFCTLNAAALVSMIEICRGRKYVTWQTVRARR